MGTRDRVRASDVRSTIIHTPDPTDGSPPVTIAPRPRRPRRPPPPGVEVDYVALASLRGALRRYLRRGEQVARAEGLTPQRHLLLLMIRGAPDGSERATIGELAERLQLAQNTVTDLVTRAAAAGLVTREPDDHDGRVTHVRVTDEGAARLARTVAALTDDREHLVAAVLSQIAGDVDPPA